MATGRDSLVPSSWTVWVMDPWRDQIVYDPLTLYENKVSSHSISNIYICASKLSVKNKDSKKYNHVETG